MPSGSPEHPEKPPPTYAADVTRTQPVGRNKSERKHLATLERRLEHLAQYNRDYPDSPSVGWRGAEIAALHWALERIADVERAQATLNHCPHCGTPVTSTWIGVGNVMTYQPCGCISQLEVAK